jgi:hypothetical protein
MDRHGSGSKPGRAGTHKAPVTLQVLVGLDRLQPLIGQQGLHGRRLVVMVLQQQPATGRQGLGGPGSNGPQGIEPIKASSRGPGPVRGPAPPEPAPDKPGCGM